MECRILGPPDAPGESQRQLRAERQGAAVGDLEVRGGFHDRSFAACDLRSDGKAVAIGRVEGEVGSVQIDADRAGPQRDAFDDLWQGIGDRRHLGGRRIHLDRGADRDVAEVVGPGDRRYDGKEAQRRALVWTGEIDLARHVDGMGAGACACDRGADLAGGWASGRGKLGEPGVERIGEPVDRRLGTVGNSLEPRGEPRRGRDRQSGEVLVSVRASDFHREGSVGAGRVVRRAGFEARREGACSSPGRVPLRARCRW